jgi:hypothetical protein
VCNRVIEQLALRQLRLRSRAPSRFTLRKFKNRSRLIGPDSGRSTEHVQRLQRLTAQLDRLVDRPRPLFFPLESGSQRPEFLITQACVHRLPSEFGLRSKRVKGIRGGISNIDRERLDDELAGDRGSLRRYSKAPNLVLKHRLDASHLRRNRGIGLSGACRLHGKVNSLGFVPNFISRSDSLGYPLLVSEHIFNDGELLRHRAGVWRMRTSREGLLQHAE